MALSEYEQKVLVQLETQLQHEESSAGLTQKKESNSFRVVGAIFLVVLGLCALFGGLQLGYSVMGIALSLVGFLGVFVAVLLILSAATSFKAGKSRS